MHQTGATPGFAERAERIDRALRREVHQHACRVERGHGGGRGASGTTA
jgi:hypothetical protein